MEDVGSVHAVSHNTTVTAHCGPGVHGSRGEVAVSVKAYIRCQASLKKKIDESGVHGSRGEEPGQSKIQGQTTVYCTGVHEYVVTLSFIRFATLPLLLLPQPSYCTV